MGENRRTPSHVGLIMDGNGRWAKKLLMPRSYGHNAGMNRMIGLAEHAKKCGVRYLTVYTLSTENFSRPKEELEGLYSLFRKYFSANAKKLYGQGAAIKIIGDLSVLPEDVQILLADGEKNSPENAEFTLIFAINYGSHAEILRAVNTAVERGEKIGAEDFAKLLYTNGIPDPDMIIRTGGEKRLSNFLLYQTAYAELYFSVTLFPDFSDEELDKALEDFSKRERRFGNV